MIFLSRLYDWSSESLPFIWKEKILLEQKWYFRWPNDSNQIKEPVLWFKNGSAENVGSESEESSSESGGEETEGESGEIESSTESGDETGSEHSGDTPGKKALLCFQPVFLHSNKFPYPEHHNADEEDEENSGSGEEVSSPIEKSKCIG